MASGDPTLTIGNGNGPDRRHLLLELAEATAPGQNVTVPREWLLDALRLPVLEDPNQPPLPYLLTPGQVASRLGVTVGHVYRIWRQIPGATKLSHRSLRFTPDGVLAFLATRKP